MSSQPPGPQPADSGPPVGVPDDPAASTASGLDERQLDPADLAALQAQFRFSSIDPVLGATAEALGGWELPAGLDTDQLRREDLHLPAARAVPLRLAPLPGKVRTTALRPEQWRPRFHKGLALALAMPIRRPRVLPGELSRAEQDAVNTAVVAKYGSAARQLTLRAVFREVPPEASKSVRLDEGLRFCQFSLPPGTPVNRLGRGYALVITTGESGKTYPALVRL